MHLRCPECQTRYEISPTSIPEGGARVRCPRCRTVFGVARPAAEPSLSAAGVGVAGFERIHAVPGDAAPADSAPAELALEAREPNLAANAAPSTDPTDSADESVEVDQAGGSEAAWGHDPQPGPGSNGHLQPMEAQMDEVEVSPVAPSDLGEAASNRPAAEPDAGLVRRPRLPGSGGRPVPAAAHAVTPGAPVEADVARRIARALVSEVLLARREMRNEALREGLLLARLGPAILEAWDRYRERVGAPIAEGTRFFHEAVNDILGEGQLIL